MCPSMAVTDSREIVIEATPDEIIDVLFDLESLPEWSSAHQKVEVLERDDQGRPGRSRQVVKIVGVSDKQVLAYSVHDDGLSWTLVSAKHQRAQDGRYTLTPDGDSTTSPYEVRTGCADHRHASIRLACQVTPGTVFARSGRLLAKECSAR